MLTAVGNGLDVVNLGTWDSKKTTLQAEATQWLHA
jgi:hypothetical protein